MSQAIRPRAPAISKRKRQVSAWLLYKFAVGSKLLREKGAVPLGADLSGLHRLADRVEALGGDLRLESSAGRGTKVIARIPHQLQTGSP